MTDCNCIPGVPHQQGDSGTSTANIVFKALQAARRDPRWYEEGLEAYFGDVSVDEAFDRIRTEHVTSAIMGHIGAALGPIVDPPRPLGHNPVA